MTKTFKYRVYPTSKQISILNTTPSEPEITGLNFKEYISDEISERTKLIPLLFIEIKGKVLAFRKPLEVKIYKENIYWVAENERLLLFGYGNCIDNALNELKTHIIYYYTHYKNIKKDKLIGQAIKLKELYNSLFSKKTCADFKKTN
jgi:hypothetical protein